MFFSFRSPAPNICIMLSFHLLHLCLYWFFTIHYFSPHVPHLSLSWFHSCSPYFSLVLLISFLLLPTFPLFSFHFLLLTIFVSFVSPSPYVLLYYLLIFHHCFFLDLFISFSCSSSSSLVLYTSSPSFSLMGGSTVPHSPSLFWVNKIRVVVPHIPSTLAEKMWVTVPHSPRLFWVNKIRVVVPHSPQSILG